MLAPTDAVVVLLGGARLLRRLVATDHTGLTVSTASRKTSYCGRSPGRLGSELRTVAQVSSRKREADTEIETFPLTRALLAAAASLPTRRSFGVAFRMTGAADYSLDGTLVSKRADRMAKKRFREAVLTRREELKLEGSKVKATYKSGAQVLFRGKKETEARDLWIALFSRPLADISNERAVRFAQVSEGTIVDASKSLRVDETLRLEARGELIDSGADHTWVLPEDDVLGTKYGMVLHGRALAGACGVPGLTASDVRMTCGSIVGHLLHSGTCNALGEDASQDVQPQLGDLEKSWREMRPQEADEALLAVLAYWHTVRDDWARDKVLIGGLEVRVRQGDWLFVPDSWILDWLHPGRRYTTRGHATVREALLPLATIGQLTTSSNGFRIPGAPPLASMIDGLAVSDTSEMPMELIRGIETLPATERRGFFVKFGESINRARMHHYLVGDRCLWGYQAHHEAKKQGADRGLISKLGTAWTRAGGYFKYPRLLSRAGAVSGWTPSQRGLARAIISNLAATSPFWRQHDAICFHDGQYWVRRYTGVTLNGLTGSFYPATGRAKAHWRLDSWMAAAGSIEDGQESGPKNRRQFVADLARMGTDLGLQWDVKRHGRGEPALEDLRSMASSAPRWNAARIELLLPTDFEERLTNLVGKPLGRTRPKKKGFWTGEQIDKMRRKKGLTQKDLAAAVGVSSSMISQLISGKKQASPTMARLLEGELGRPSVLSRDYLRET